MTVADLLTLLRSRRTWIMAAEWGSLVGAFVLALNIATGVWPDHFTMFLWLAATLAQSLLLTKARRTADAALRLASASRGGDRPCCCSSTTQN